ncbi:MAG: acyl-CoA thioesterase [Desulfobacteraceae bacterium]|nr:acyl-CoA thioesterase [Desulfobacteraceae bacterium]
MASQAQIRVIYGDTDAMGFAYYGNYLKWFEIGRSEWFRQTGTSYRELESSGLYLPVVEAHCSYKKPAFYDDTLTIRAAFRFAGARLRFDYRIFRGEELLTEGYTLHVCMNNAKKVQKPPEFLRKLLEPVQDL